MTDEELEAIEKACAEATPGPWSVLPYPPGYLLVGPTRTPYSYEGEVIKADAEFSAGARQWLPEILAEVKRLRHLCGQREREAEKAINERNAALSRMDLAERLMMDEREACAKLVETVVPHGWDENMIDRELAAEAIRARKP